MTVNRKLQALIAVSSVLIIGVCMTLLALMRIKDARGFSQSYRVQDYAGTNYAVKLLETTVGKVETGYVVIVYARFENPNPTELVLKRDWFVLADRDKDYYSPTTSGTQTPLIKIPPNGVLERETLSYVVGDDALAGTLALEIGRHYFVLLKDEAAWKRKLAPGQFVTFHSTDWS